MRGCYSHIMGPGARRRRHESRQVTDGHDEAFSRASGWNRRTRKQFDASPAARVVRGDSRKALSEVANGR